MKFERRLIARLTVIESGELLAVAKEKFDLETRAVVFHQLPSVQFQVGRSQHDVTWLGQVFPIDEDDHTQFPPERFVPDDGCVDMDIPLIFPRSEIFKSAQVLPVDLTVVLALAPATAWVLTGIQKQAISIAAQLRDRMESETDNFINIFLLREVAI